MLKPKLPQLSPERKSLIRHLCNLFIVDGKPGGEVITEGQMHIVNAIVFRENKYVEVICYTQYGKSLWTGLATLIVACIQKKIVCIVAPSKDKAKLIMRYFIDHLGDSIAFYSQLEKNTKLDRLKQEESKERIILKDGGGIFALSVDQRNSGKSIEAAMGMGAEIVIKDESGLVEDDTEATVFRMITGKTGTDKLYMKIGNPFYSTSPRSHFKLDWENPNFHKIFIDAQVGLQEGRITQEELAFAKTKPLYSILFDCEFPDESAYDKDGYQQLIMTSWIKYNEHCRDEVSKMVERERELADLIKNAEDYKKKEEYVKELKMIPPTKLGADIARGKDSNVYVIRKGKFAFVAGANQSHDTMVNVNNIIDLIEEFDIRHENVNIDDTGVGGGVVDRLLELGYNVNGVSNAESATDKDRYANIKAEMFWDMMLWIMDGGELNEDPNWGQLVWIKYKQQSGEKKIILEPKDKLKQRTKKSPDYADSLALTFVSGGFVGFV